MKEINWNESTDLRAEMQIKAEELRKKMVGRKYRHFKGTTYIVTGIAVHSETAELMVLYHKHTPHGYTADHWTRPLDMFLSPVDKEKYPDVTQEMRFEQDDSTSMEW